MASVRFARRGLVSLGLIAALALRAAAADQLELVVLPDNGKLLAYARAEEPGKWIVFGPNGFKPIQPTIADAGKAIFWQGTSGEYAVIYLPPGDEQPLVQVVTLGGGEPVPPPPPPPPPGERIAVILEESDARTPAQGRLWDQLRAKYPSDRGKLWILDDDLKIARPYVELTSESYRPLLMLFNRTADGRTVLVRAVPCPDTLPAVIAEIEQQ